MDYRLVFLRNNLNIEMECLKTFSGWQYLYFQQITHYQEKIKQSFPLTTLLTSKLKLYTRETTDSKLRPSLIYQNSI